MPSETLRELEAMMQDAEEGDVYLEMEQTTEDESDDGDSDYMLAEDEIEEEFEEEVGDDDEEEEEQDEEEEEEGVQGGAITLRRECRAASAAYIESQYQSTNPISYIQIRANEYASASRSRSSSLRT